MPDLSPLPGSASSAAGLLSAVRGRTVMIVGRSGTGKTTLTRAFLGRLAPSDAGVLITADMGQPAVGTPTCLGFSAQPPYDRVTASWFVGDISPVGNLLPAVVGTARLVDRARAAGARTIIIDTTGLVEGPMGRVLKYHKTVAAGVDCVVAVQYSAELEPILSVLESPARTIHRLSPSPHARDRTPGQRKAWREEQYRRCFHDCRPHRFPSASIIGTDWQPLTGWRVDRGTVVGLLDRGGFCIGLGLVDKTDADGVYVIAPHPDQQGIARVQVGKVRLAMDGLGEARP